MKRTIDVKSNNLSAEDQFQSLSTTSSKEVITSFSSEKVSEYSSTLVEPTKASETNNYNNDTGLAHIAEPENPEQSIDSTVRIGVEDQAKPEPQIDLTSSVLTRPPESVTRQA